MIEFNITPARAIVSLKGMMARIDRLTADRYKRVNSKTYDQRMLELELSRLGFMIMVAKKTRYSSRNMATILWAQGILDKMSHEHAMVLIKGE